MTFASRVSARLPERLLVRLISLAYLRFEPEIRRLDEVCGHGGRGRPRGTSGPKGGRT